MPRLLLLGLSLALASSSIAQRTTSPRGFENKTGPAYSAYLGIYANTHFQQIDGNLRGPSRLIVQVAFRQDDLRSGSSAEARTYDKVTVMVGHGNVSSATSTFASNFLDTPKTVLNGVKLNLPNWSKLSTVKPAPFDLKLAFKSPWIYDGKRDIVIDVKMQGGKLASNSSWSGSRAKFYYADGITNLAHRDSPQLAAGTRNCKDSASSSGAYTFFALWTYPKNAGKTTDNQIFLRTLSRYTAPAAPVVHILGGKINTNGIPIGVACNKLHVFPILVLFVGMTSGRTSLYQPPKMYFPYQRSLVGVQLSAQAAWFDSKTSALKLSEAVEVSVQLQPTKVHNAKSVYWYDLTRLRGRGPFDVRVPIVQYN